VARLGRGGTVFPRALPTLGAYRLRGGSPLRGAALNLARLFGVTVPSQTFSGAWPTHNVGAE
jgi:hypothetical protein